MRRLLPLVLLTALLPLGSGPASACPNPEEGEPPPCCTSYRNVVELGDGVIYLTIPDPTSPPCNMREIEIPLPPLA